MICKGFAHKYGNHVDTDAIVPARALNNPDPEALASRCMEDLDAGFIGRVKPGDIMAAGLNFGCGSSREHAPIALKASGISCVIAHSFARIFFRNSMNIGLPLLECPEAADAVQMGDELEVNLDTGVIKNLTRGGSYTAIPVPEFMRSLLSSGGLVAYTKSKLKGEAAL